jgi:hypothetical protein
VSAFVPRGRVSCGRHGTYHHVLYSPYQVWLQELLSSSDSTASVPSRVRKDDQDAIKRTTNRSRGASHWHVVPGICSASSACLQFQSRRVAAWTIRCSSYVALHTSQQATPSEVLLLSSGCLSILEPCAMPRKVTLPDGACNPFFECHSSLPMMFLGITRLRPGKFRCNVCKTDIDSWRKHVGLVNHGLRLRESRWERFDHWHDPLTGAEISREHGNLPHLRFGRVLPHIPNRARGRSQDRSLAATSLNFDAFRSPWFEPPNDDGSPLSMGDIDIGDFNVSFELDDEIFHGLQSLSESLSGGPGPGPMFESSTEDSERWSAAYKRHLPDRSGLYDPEFMPYPSKEVCHLQVLHKPASALY